MNKDTYNRLLKDIKDFENNKAIFLMTDKDELHKRKMYLYSNGFITKEQAISIENRIDSIL